MARSPAGSQNCSDGEGWCEGWCQQERKAVGFCSACILHSLTWMVAVWVSLAWDIRRDKSHAHRGEGPGDVM